MSYIEKGYNEVYTADNSNDSFEIESDVCYLTIPADWIPTYRKLLMFVADYGKHILDDCNIACKGTGSIVFNCWNLFQSACAAYTMEDFEKAVLFKDYVDKQINLVDKEVNDTTFKYTVTPDGSIKVNGNIIDNKVSFTTNKSTYEKYKEWIDNYKLGRVCIKSD